MSVLETQKHWNKVASDVLKGRTIVEVRYLNDKEMKDSFLPPIEGEL